MSRGHFGRGDGHTLYMNIRMYASGGTISFERHKNVVRLGQPRSRSSSISMTCRRMVPLLLVGRRVKTSNIGPTYCRGCKLLVSRKLLPSHGRRPVLKVLKNKLSSIKSLAYSQKEFETIKALSEKKNIYGESNIAKIAFSGTPPECGMSERK